MALSGSFYNSICSGNYKLRVDWSATQSISGNFSKIICDIYLVQSTYWDLYVSGRACTAVIDGTSYPYTAPAINNSGGKTTKLGTVTSDKINHNSDGSKTLTITITYPIRATISGVYYESIVSEKNITLDTIPRATQPTLSVSSAYMGNSVTINTPRASTKFTHDLAYSFAGSGWITIKTGVTTSYDWTVPDKASSIPSATSGTMTIRCITKNGSTTIGTKTVLLTAKVPTSVVPTINEVNVSETIENINSQFGVFIKNHSALTVDITAVGAKGSTIKSYSTVFNGKTYLDNSWTSDVITKSGKLNLITTVTDSRGRTAKKTTAIQVLDYTKPQIESFNVFRCTNVGQETDDGESLLIEYKYSVPSLNGGNTVNALVEYKRSIDTTWTSLFSSTDISDDTSKIFTDVLFSTDYQYDIRLTVTDYFGAYDDYLAILRSGEVIFDISADGKGFSFGATADRTGVKFGWPAKGKVLGLGEATAMLASGDDFNNYYMELGVFGVESDEIAKTLVNRPSDHAGTFRVYSATGTENVDGKAYYILQEYRSRVPSEPLHIRAITKSADGVWAIDNTWIDL